MFYAVPSIDKNFVSQETFKIFEPNLIRRRNTSFCTTSLLLLPVKFNIEAATKLNFRYKSVYLRQHQAPIPRGSEDSDPHRNCRRGLIWLGHHENLTEINVVSAKSTPGAAFFVSLF